MKKTLLILAALALAIPALVVKTQAAGKSCAECCKDKCEECCKSGCDKCEKCKS
jgi:hypothetical protein